MNWRPETWKNPYQHAASIPQNKFFNRDYYIYEAGADAMLEALKKEGRYYKWKRIATVKVPSLYQEQWKGWFTFIPDEEEK